MSSKLWMGSVDSAFGTAGNWSPIGVPATGDDVVFDGQAVSDLTGADESAITLASLRIYRSCTRNIGSAAVPLKIGATLCEIGLTPEGGSSSTGPQTVAIDFATIQTTCTVFANRGNGASGFSSTLLRGTNASNKLTVKGGGVGVGTMNPGEASTFAEINIDGAGTAVTLGYGLTLTTVNQRDGTIYLGSAVTNLNQSGGHLETRGAGAITTAKIGGTLVSGSTGTITTLHVSGGGIADFSASARSRTITNAVIYGPSAKILANNFALIAGTGGTATPSIIFTNGVQLREGANSTQADFGGEITVTPSTLT